MRSGLRKVKESLYLRRHLAIWSVSEKSCSEKGKVGCDAYCRFGVQ